MRCPRCRTVYPPPTALREPRLRCHVCGARLFAWLGDPFGIYEADASPDRRRHGIEPLPILIAGGFLLVVLSCLCLAAFNH
jgi:hypothetical protein